MALLAEGIWPCTVLNGAFGEDMSGSPQVQISIRIDDGPNKGRHCTYEDQVNARSSLYIGRSCKAVGWKGGPAGDDPETLKADIDTWIKATGGKTTVEIRHLLIKTGKREGQIWDKVNSLGRGPRPLKAASPERLADAREAMRAALAADSAAGAADGAYDEPPHDDVPHAAGSAISDDDIPFVSSMFDHEPIAIARVLR